ncbi:MAG: ATP-binding protein [Deltaproteobacteria bacterium]|nr:ATP-binding protein [Deltaproteobacteria bacterium]
MKDRLLFNICPEGEFFGRLSEINYIIERAKEPAHPSRTLLLGRRWTGKTEILRRAHRELFWGQGSVVPVYYQFRGYGGISAAEDFLKEFIKQYLAFRKRDPEAIRQELPLERLEKLLMDSDSFGLSEIISIHNEAKRGGDTSAALKNAYGAPSLIEARSGVPVYLLLDDIDKASVADDGAPALIDALAGALNASTSFIASSSSKGIAEAGLFSHLEVIELKGLGDDVSVAMMAELCRKYGVESESEVLSYAAGRLEHNPMHIKSLIWAASRAGVSLKDLKNLIGVYANELFDGNIGCLLRSYIKVKTLNGLRVLNYIARSGSASEEELIEKFKCGKEELKKLLDEFSAAGIVEEGLGSIRWAGGRAAREYISYVFETRVKGRSPDEVKSSLVRDSLKEGFSLKGAKVQPRFKEDVSRLLRSFNGQKVLKVLLRNPVFAARFKNGAYRAVESRKEEDEVLLPQVIGCFDSLRWERNETGPAVIIAQGFQNNRYDSGNEVVWITGVKEALSPINLGDAESFIRRSLILKENFRGLRIARWMVGGEGFTAEAQKRLEAEGVYSTDSAQMRILKESLEDKGAAERLKSSPRIVPNKEFEVVIPSSTKAELVAAKAVEEIGTEMGFDENSIAQIKAALVESCINAFEHSKIKSGKVFLKFIAGEDRLTIHVQNSGAELDAPAGQGAAPLDSLPKKRGWGFELMKGLMDEVRLERVHNGAKIVLVKYLMRKGDRDDKEA